MSLAKRSGSLSETQDALGHHHASTTGIYVESIAVKTDQYSQHILEALELPGFEIDFSSDSDRRPGDKRQSSRLKPRHSVEKSVAPAIYLSALRENLGVEIDLFK